MKIDKSQLGAVHAAAKSGTPGRANLAAVHFTTDGHAVATDGHMLAIVDPPGDAKEDRNEPALEAFTLPAAGLVDLNKAIPKRHGWPYAELDVAATNSNGTARFTIPAQDFEARELRKDEGTFPDYTAVIPKGKAAFTVGINVDLLVKLAKVAKACDAANSHIALTFSADKNGQPDNLGPIVVRSTSGNGRMYGLVMPVRTDGK